ncbi:MAG: DUF4430 domain-containing protein [Clostridium sp.]|nr:DUF4430 domain-containing protein [Clostridium sp.]
MKLKKALYLFFIIFILFTFTSCSSNASTDNSSVQSSSELSSIISESSKSNNSSSEAKSQKEVTTKSSTAAKESKPVSTATAKAKPTSTQKEKTTKSKHTENKTAKQTTTKKTYTCTFSIECSTILNNIEKLDSGKKHLVPSNGIILSSSTVEFSDGESVYDVLQRVCKDNKIQMEASWTGIYNSAYIEGINNLYEFDCGSASGWKYSVNGWYPNYGCSKYLLKQGDVVAWRYTCDYGKDIGSK